MATMQIGIFKYLKQLLLSLLNSRSLPAKLLAQWIGQSFTMISVAKIIPAFSRDVGLKNKEVLLCHGDKGRQESWSRE